MSRILNGWRATGLLAGAVALVAGCAQDHVQYVPTVQTQAVYGGLAPSAPPPPITPPPPPVYAEAAPAPAPAAPPAPVVMLRSSAELDRMLGPIALYPDPLIAQILPAATLPEQVVLADRYVRGGGDVGQIDAQSWDLSVKALARYPGVLRMMDDNLAWTADLGQAFLNQPADVMDAIQRLRAQARAVGNLQSTPQQTIVMDQGAIEIVPANPQVIYVPVYQPEIVYAQPPPPAGGLWISFGAGFAVGGWLNHDCDWHSHNVIVWHPNHPRPPDWWYHPAARPPHPVAVKPVTGANKPPVSTPHSTVWHPQARPAVSGLDRADRGWSSHEARPSPTPKGTAPPSPPKQVPPAQAARDTHPVVAAKDTHPVQAAKPAQPPVAVNESRPAAQSREVHPAPVLKPAQAAPAQKAPPTVSSPKEVRPAPAPKPAVHASSPPANARPVPKPAARPEPAPSRPSPALAGIESARATRESSSRGQQSRETIARPAPAAHSPAPAAPAPARVGGDSKKH